jgi:hypothetical protein
MAWAAPMKVNFDVKNPAEFERFVVFTHVLCPADSAERQSYSLDTTGKLWLLNCLDRIDSATQVCVSDPADDFETDQVQSDQQHGFEIKAANDLHWHDSKVQFDKIAERLGAAWWAEDQLSMKALLTRTDEAIMNLRKEEISFPIMDPKTLKFELDSEELDKFNVPPALLYNDRMAATLSSFAKGVWPEKYTTWLPNWQRESEERRKLGLKLVDEKMEGLSDPPIGEVNKLLKNRYVIDDKLMLLKIVEIILPVDEVRDNEAKKSLFNTGKYTSEEAMANDRTLALNFHKVDVFLECFGTNFFLKKPVQEYLETVRATYSARKRFSMPKPNRELLRQRFRQAWELRGELKCGKKGVVFAKLKKHVEEPEVVQIENTSSGASSAIPPEQREQPREEREQEIGEEVIEEASDNRPISPPQVAPPVSTLLGEK